ncbi:DUF4269 domain-containing protein [Labilibaculum sp.]|uniref:DUF4269 domain-containing protein n=1 Tax=Labilibaculum sp. TaxID=2060723 RepID=UPI00356402DA
MELEHNFDNIDYLKDGNEKQKRVYNLLTKCRILETLWEFDPILVGTIPINIDIESSDLDIICYCKDKAYFKKFLEEKFAGVEGFKMWENTELSTQDTVANFVIDGFEIEIFGQNIPSKQQNAYRHMIIENKLIKEEGEGFRQRIIALKQKGYKTEPAFGIELGLVGDSYKALLELGTKID